MGYELRRVMGSHADFAVRPGGSGEPLTFMPEASFRQPTVALIFALDAAIPGCNGIEAALIRLVHLPCLNTFSRLPVQFSSWVRHAQGPAFLPGVLASIRTSFSRKNPTGWETSLNRSRSPTESAPREASVPS